MRIAAGVVATGVTIPAGTTPGEHTLTASGAAPDGSTRCERAFVIPAIVRCGRLVNLVSGVAAARMRWCVKPMPVLSSPGAARCAT